MIVLILFPKLKKKLKNKAKNANKTAPYRPYLKILRLLLMLKLSIFFEKKIPAEK